ncbi:MAG: Appr-1-p processing protein [Myxococcales bacterium]|nr:MAG: Appr-1-p processing protein [Myxococcales bacterium]
MEFLVGDVTRPAGQGPKLLVHLCNDVGSWGQALDRSLDVRWSEPRTRYQTWHREGLALGETQFVQVEPDITIVNLIGKHDVGPIGGVAPVRYEAIRAGLARVREAALEHSASVHMPRIGCGLAGGSWERIRPIVHEELCVHGIHVTVYALPR